MRRFIESRPGAAVCYLVTIALLTPIFTFISWTRADAQIESQAQWTVIQFANKGKGGDAYGRMAADAVFGEFSKLGKYSLTPQDSVDRQMAELGFQPPLTRVEDQLRLASNLGANTVVAGEIKDWRIVDDNGGKRADVLVRVFVRDVASGQLVNGAAVGASSSRRMGEVSEETLLSEAFASAAFEIVRQVESNSLPNATVLNTLEKTALINQGARTGFKVGMNVIVLRGREQVAEATVSEVDPDSSFVKVTRSNKGVQPGDKVRAVFAVPDIKGFGKDGSAVVAKAKKAPNVTALLTLLLVLGLIYFLLQGNRSTDSSVIQDVGARAMLDNADNPAVEINWRPESFFTGGNQNRFAFQIWRDDVPDTPVLVVDGQLNVGRDSNDGRTFTWYQQTVGGPSGDPTDCPGLNSQTGDTIAPLIFGRPYSYSVELVYRVSALDLGGSTGGGTTGTTATTGLTTGGTTGLTTGGTTGLTTGGTTGLTTGRVYGDEGSSRVMMRPWTEAVAETTGTTTGTTGASFCYWVSTRVAARGTATPLGRASLTAPENNAQVDINVPRPFQFLSVRGAVPIAIEYVLQLSPDPTFPSNRSVTTASFIDNQPSNVQLSTAPVNLKEIFAQFPGATSMWWRIGAKNVGDVPGPVGGYIWSAARQFRPAGGPDPVMSILMGTWWR